MTPLFWRKRPLNPTQVELQYLLNTIIRPGLKLAENTEGFLWFCSDKTLFKIENNFILVWSIHTSKKYQYKFKHKNWLL